MKIVRSLRVTRSEFFAYIEQSIASEYEKAQGEALALDKVNPGLSFAVGEPGKQTARMSVVENDGVSRFATRLSGPGMVSTASYALESDGDGIRVVYEQDISDLSARKRGLVRLFSEAVTLGRMAASLLDAEAAIRSRRCSA